MADEREDTMNLDLNLGPFSPASPGIDPGMGLGAPASSGEALNSDEWPDDPLHQSIREALRQRTRQRWRWRHVQLPLGNQSMRFRVSSSSGGAGADGGVSEGGALQVGEGSVAADERSSEEMKTCENTVTQLENGGVNKNEEVEKESGEEGSFFDCNICLDLAREPVVTCCGHLFCWPCLYRWLHLHSEAKECPVCKGEVTPKNVTPIYGRGSNNRDPEEDSDIKIPIRPPARRVESLRQTIQRTAFSFPMEEMFRRLGSRFDLTRDFLQPQDIDSTRDALERSNSLLNRILTSRGMRREQNVGVPPDDVVVDLTQDTPPRPEPPERRTLPPLIFRRSQAYRSASVALASAMGSAVEAYFRNPPPGRNQEQPPSVDDRDSFSSIAAVIHGESQTVDTAVEIDSMVSFSTSSSRRRNDASRASDMDSGDSRTPRRRRLN